MEKVIRLCHLEIPSPFVVTSSIFLSLAPSINLHKLCQYLTLNVVKVLWCCHNHCVNKNLILATSIVKIIATFILKYDYGESHNIKLVEENKASQEDG